MSTHSRRRSLSESSYSALKMEDDPSFTLPCNELVDDHHPLLLSKSHGGDRFAAMEQRSKSESLICTAQGIVFQDTKCQEYGSKLNNLVALAADSSSSQSNVVLAKKALRYRKVLERHRFIV
ncbi:unnamed protein product [Peronospora effusa]|uniref:Uncharacterized protein n=1 Tax=Peronospora effusa TaxID=542832 RepID=A0A3M6VEA8_9STRA|nr:hypothetical protein DD238_005389 [Peronospora effusa]RQM13767.1 hypothetical protein DD237_006067 [Peronospora effusa]CAI5707412.1 unnamed protein product [Peronospora effusa]